jgi:hypothetical protein
MKKLLLFVFLNISFAFISCTYHNIYINREQDNLEGKEFLKKFYSNIHDKNYMALDSMASDSLKHLSGPDALSKLVRLINKKVGEYKSYSIIDVYNRAIIGSNSVISFNYKLSVKYDSGTVEEIVGFGKHDDIEIKMNSYHANSNLFMK